MALSQLAPVNGIRSDSALDPGPCDHLVDVRRAPCDAPSAKAHRWRKPAGFDASEPGRGRNGNTSQHVWQSQQFVVHVEQEESPPIAEDVYLVAARRAAPNLPMTPRRGYCERPPGRSERPEKYRKLQPGTMKRQNAYQSLAVFRRRGLHRSAAAFRRGCVHRRNVKYVTL